MTNGEAAIKGLKSLVEVRRKYGDMQTMKDEIECLDMGIKELTAISELSKSLKAVNRYDMDEKVLIGFNMAVAIFNECFGEIGALKNEQSEQNVGMCQQNVGEMSEKQTDGDLISRKAVINALCALCDIGGTLKENPWRDNPHIDAVIETIEQIPSAENTAEWIPVSERLPEIHQDVLVSLRSLDVEVGFRAETELCFYCEGEYIELQNVLAWMPLPGPYKVE